MKVKLLGGNPAAPSAETKNSEVHNAYLQGQYFVERRDRESLEKALGYTSRRSSSIRAMLAPGRRSHDSGACRLIAATCRARRPIRRRTRQLIKPWRWIPT
jgi:hypothetical protein